MPQQITSFFLALFLGAAPFSVQGASTSATVARLEVRISTTSPWTQVAFRPGRIAAARLVSVPADVRVVELGDGWVVNTPGGKPRTVVVRAAFEEPAGAPAIRVVVRKGYTGRTSVDVQNISAAAFSAARVLNQLPAASSGVKGSDGLTLTVARTRREFLGTRNPVVPQADPVRRVLAVYYPWYQAYGDPRFADRPAVARSTATYHGVLSMTRQARTAGIGGFIVSWQGEASSGRGFDLALNAAEATDGVVTPYLEMLQAHGLGDTSGRADPRIVLEWLVDTLERADSPAFLRSGGVPVVFVFQLGALPRVAWLNVLNELAKRGLAVKLVGDADMRSYGAVQWGIHEYTPNPFSPDALTARYRRIAAETRLLSSADAAAPHLFVATVSPGYDDSKLAERVTHLVVPRAAGHRYLATWASALAARPDWIMVTSWNEWFEGTAVEPSLAHGDLALRQTAAQAERFAA